MQPDYMTRLVALRRNAGFTQIQVAKYLKTSQSMYASYEGSKNALPTRHLIALCDLYEVSADEVLGLDFVDK